MRSAIRSTLCLLALALSLLLIALGHAHAQPVGSRTMDAVSAQQDSYRVLDETAGGGRTARPAKEVSTDQAWYQLPGLSARATEMTVFYFLGLAFGVFAVVFAMQNLVGRTFKASQYLGIGGILLSVSAAVAFLAALACLFVGTASHLVSVAPGFVLALAGVLQPAAAWMIEMPLRFAPWLVSGVPFSWVALTWAALAFVVGALLQIPGRAIARRAVSAS